MRRRIDVLDAAASWKIFGSDVGPCLAIVARDIERAIITAGPDYALFQRGFRNRIKRAVELFAGNVARNRLAARTLATGGLSS